MIPTRLIVELAAAAAALIAAVVFGMHVERARLMPKLEQERTAHAADRAAWASAAASASEAARAEEQRRASAVSEVTREAQRLETVADAGRAAAAAAGGRMLDAARAAAARCGGAAVGSAAAASSAPADRPGAVLADVLAEVERAGRAMAEEADRRGIAGSACERAYDAVMR